MRRRGSGDENGSLENFHTHSCVTSESGCRCEILEPSENYRVLGFFLLPKRAGAGALVYGLYGGEEVGRRLITSSSTFCIFAQWSGQISGCSWTHLHASAAPYNDGDVCPPIVAHIYTC